MNAIVSTVSKTLTKAKFKVGKHGPAIAVTVGVIGMAGAIYLTYRAATKIEAAKEERDKGIEEVNNALDAGMIEKADGTNEIYTAEDGEKDKKIYNTRFIINVVKYGGIALLTFIFSAAAVAKGFRTEVKRGIEKGKAIEVLTQQIKDIKEELDNAVGKEKANDIMLGKHTHTETEISEDGEVTTKEVETTNKYVSGYTFEFSKASSPMLYSGDYKRDNDFIMGCQNQANYLMKEKHGHVFFNEILDEFEIERVPYGNTDGSLDKDGHTIIFDVDDRKDEHGGTYFIITVNMQGYILNKI